MEVRSLLHSNRILLILPDAAIGGGHTMNLRLADELTRRGWVVDVVFLFSRYKVATHAASYPKLQLIQMNADSRIRRLLLPMRLARMARSYDLVLAGLDLAATNYGYLAARLAKKPFVSWMHTAFSEHARSMSRVSCAISLWVYRKIPNIVFPSFGAMESLSRALRGKPPSSTWHVIENFHETASDSRPETEKAPIPKHVCEHPIVLSIGRLSEPKAYDRLIRIHAQLRQRGIVHHLVILGEGPERAKLEALATQLNVSDTFFLPGHIPNPRDWIAESSVFALCSRYEGLPLVLIEALQSGMAIAAMDCPAGPREILDSGKCGLLVPPGDENALADSIASLLRDPALRALLGDRGKLKAKIYEPSVIIPRWENLLGSLIGSSSLKS